MKFPTLFTTRENGGLQEWTLEVDGNKMRTHSGKVGGKIMVSIWVESEGKNKGQSNETTPEEQCMKEAQSKWDHHIEKGYSEDPKNAGKTEFFEPMLANKFKDREKIVTYPIFAQPKLDGIRTICTIDGIFSRNGKPLPTLNFIRESLQPVFDQYPELVIDGEGYADKLSKDFNKIISIVKKMKPTLEDIKEAKEFIKYHVYDCNLGGNEVFSVRSKFINDLLKSYSYVSLVATYEVKDRAELDTLYGQMLQDNYEGQMIRLDAKYENRRTNSLLKRKEFQDAEYKILEVHEGVGNRTGTVGYMCFKTPDGRDFRSNIKGTHPYLRELLARKDSLIGKMATIKFFDLSKDMVPRFPFVIKIREGIEG